jgi:diacylglycerol kinase
MSRFFNSFRFAWNGIIVAFKEQPNLKVHVLIAGVVVAAGFTSGSLPQNGRYLSFAFRWLLRWS